MAQLFNIIAEYTLLLLIITIGLYLILILHQALLTVRQVRSILATQDSDIRQTLTQLPQLLTALDALTISLKQSSDFAHTTMRPLRDDLTNTAHELRKNFETLTTYSKLTSDIIRTFINNK